MVLSTVLDHCGIDFHIHLHYCHGQSKGRKWFTNRVFNIISNILHVYSQYILLDLVVINISQFTVVGLISKIYTCFFQVRTWEGMYDPDTERNKVPL